MAEFTLTARVPEPYDEVVARVRALLADAGFGVLTEIDLQATMRAKLGVELAPQVILGACRPPLALEALRADPRLATMLPCTVVVSGEEQDTRVEVFDPAVMTSFSDSPALREVAADARRRLSGMMEALTESVPTREGEEADAARA